MASTVGAPLPIPTAAAATTQGASTSCKTLEETTASYNRGAWAILSCKKKLHASLVSVRGRSCEHAHNSGRASPSLLEFSPLGTGHGAARIVFAKTLRPLRGTSSPRMRGSRGAAGAYCRAAAVENGENLEEVKVKIMVGQVGALGERVFRFQKIFGPSSSLIVVTMPKPLGIVFVESPWRDATGKHRVVVGGLVTGGNAERAARVSQLFVGAPTKSGNPNMPVLDGGVMPGDILRATTTAGVVVDFFGIRRPQRVMDLYVADGRPWHLTMRALNASFVADGHLTLVFERRH